jgi:NADH-quinone oxidoreductase subunit H
MDLYHFWITLITIVVVMGAILTSCAYLVFVERKVCAWMQDRIGPNRVGWWGLLQPAADGLKFLFKEDVIPDRVDKLLYLLAPAVGTVMALLAFAVVPFGPSTVPPNLPPADAPAAAVEQYEREMQAYQETYQGVIAPGVDIGLVFVFAVTSLNVYAIILGGWSSNNKYSLVGALRSSAQVISYEIPLATSILGLVLLSGSLNLEEMIHAQTKHGILSWYIWTQPLAFLLFFTSVLAECNRMPFDLPEAEQELIGGYHTEYSALKFGLFFLAEYTHVITTSFLLAILFFGGWHFPLIAEPGYTGLFAGLVKLVVLLVKMGGFILLYMLLRWTIPRFRFDQLMALAWRAMIPLAFVNLVCVMVVKELKLSQWVLLPVSLVVLVGAGLLAGFWPRGPKRVVVVTRGYERVETVVQ